MRLSLTSHALGAVALLVLAPGTALAQNEIADQANQVAEQAQEVEQQADDLGNQASADEAGYVARADDDNDFPWGLLGLLGLAGLLGLKRNDRDIHVDARRDTRP